MILCKRCNKSATQIDRVFRCMCRVSIAKKDGSGILISKKANLDEYVVLETAEEIFISNPFKAKEKSK